MRLLALGLLAGLLQGQEVPAPPAGTVIFSAEKGLPEPAKAQTDAVPEVTTAEREAWTFTAYDLDVHLVPARAGMTVRARVTVRNDSSVSQRVVPLQVSSSLHWESVTGSAVAGFGQHEIDTDADHTGRATEAVVTYSTPVAPGASVELTAFYTGEIHASAERLERIGAPVTDAGRADWDAIAPDLTALRGFGDVLWYPVSAEPIFLGDGAKLFQAVGLSRLRQAGATIWLRLSVAYVGDPPDAAFFCGRREALKAVNENQDVPVAESPGVATAEFATEPLGFRSPSLFVTDRAPTVTNDMLIAAVTDHYDTVPAYAAAAELVRPPLMEWLGTAPLTQLQVIDHAGQPFEDDALLVMPMRAAAPGTLAPALVHSLSHIWFRSDRAWLDHGVPQLMSLLWLEQTKGRQAAIDSLADGAHALALAEPEVAPDSGQALAPLTKRQPGASDDVFYRTKAAAVLWMLRSIAGDEALKQVLRGYRTARDADPIAFEAQLEKSSHKDLRWFFDDWVYRDRGLPDLTIASVTPRELPAVGGKPAGWLVAVEVRNDGDAAAEVPVTVRSGTLTASSTVRIAGKATASTRILFQAVPEEVTVNDGGVPEVRAGVHTMRVQTRAGQ